MMAKYTVLDFDGMGGCEKDYHCGVCNATVDKADNFCKACGNDISVVRDLGLIGTSKEIID